MENKSHVRVIRMRVLRVRRGQGCGIDESSTSGSGRRGCPGCRLSEFSADGEVEVRGVEEDGPALCEGSDHQVLDLLNVMSCAQRHIEALHQNFDGETSIYIDDRSFTAASATQLIERIDHWRAWSLQAGLIESEKAQDTARGRPAMRALQTIGEESMIKPVVTVLGIVTRSLQRGNAHKEEDRLALANRRLALLRLLHVNASKYAYYGRLFALSCCYGWLARHPTQTLTMKFWATVKAGQGVNRQAHKWLRCLPYGAKNHLDCIAGCNLVRVVMQLLKDGPLRWHKMVARLLPL